MNTMPRKSDVTTEQLVDYLSRNFGNDINAAMVQDACGIFGVTYATGTKRLRDFYVRRGTWNLTVQEKLEQTYQAPAAAHRHSCSCSGRTEPYSCQGCYICPVR